VSNTVVPNTVGLTARIIYIYTVIYFTSDALTSDHIPLPTKIWREHFFFTIIYIYFRLRWFGFRRAVIGLLPSLIGQFLELWSSLKFQISQNITNACPSTLHWRENTPTHTENSLIDMWKHSTEVIAGPGRCYKQRTRPW